LEKAKNLDYYYKNDEIDLDAIIDDFTPYITKIINNGTDSKLTFEDKEEIFTDTFFILWKNSKKINIEISLDSYLAGITKNLIKEKYRKMKLTYEISDYENDIKLLVDTNFYETERESLYDIEDKIMNLKETDREIIKLFYYYSKSIKDIAKTLNISEINVKTKLHRIRRKIRKELEKGGI
jgi:RNA polymerase sigma-70 factor (ECF subfamily)